MVPRAIPVPAYRSNLCGVHLRDMLKIRCCHNCVRIGRIYHAPVDLRPLTIEIVMVRRLRRTNGCLAVKQQIDTKRLWCIDERLPSGRRTYNGRDSVLGLASCVLMISCTFEFYVVMSKFSLSYQTTGTLAKTMVWVLDSAQWVDLYSPYPNYGPAAASPNSWVFSFMIIVNFMIDHAPTVRITKAHVGFVHPANMNPQVISAVASVSRKSKDYS